MQCSIACLQSALAGNLPAEEETALHQHLDVCDECSTALDRLAGGPAWCREASSLLSEDEFDDSLPSREEWSEIDFTVEHLEPSDEPGVLGRLGGYDVLEIIGHGGMGVVLKAYDRELKRTVAIKVLAPHLARNSLARKRFAREAQAAAAVVHPHVLAIHQVQASGRLPFLVMPLVPGESLAERLAARGTLELNEILRIGMQAAAGLAAAHEQGLVHRDVKPANILLERGVERAVLTDFGLARAADDVTLTRWGVVAGTPQYMSPEQARGEPLDGRSDLFSLGCVLYEMATGVSPFRTESPLATMRRLVDDSPQPIDAINPELPPWFVAIVHRLLEKDPSRRFQTAAEVSELLEGCLAHVQHPAAVPLPAGLTVPLHQPDRASGRFASRVPRKLLIGAALALPLLLAGVVIVLETNKGTLTIESEAADVAVRITQGDEVVEKLTVTRGKNDVRIAAGEYVVEIDGQHDTIAVKDGNVTIHRGEKEIVSIVQRDAPARAENEQIKMTASSVRVLTLDYAIPRAQVDNPDILQLVAQSPNAVRLIAKKPGVTQIKLWNEHNKLQSIDVLVLGDARELEILLRNEFPFANIQVRPLKQSVVLSGFVDHQDQVSQIIRIAEKYYPKVISHITVGGAQRDDTDGGHATPQSSTEPGETRLWNDFGVTPSPVSAQTAKVLEWIGLHLSPIRKEQFRDKNVLSKYSGGLDVTFVRTHGPAEKAGIHEVDIVLKIQGREIRTLEALDLAMQSAVDRIQRGHDDLLELDVLRSGETIRVNVPFPARELVLQTSVSAERIAKQVAERLEELKSTFPHLKDFSAAEHLTKNRVRNEFAPGTPSNPEFYSIAYSNGVLATELATEAPPSGPRKSADVKFDPQTGIQLNIHFFKGDSRGADPRPPYRIGDLSIHVYVKGPAAEAIRKEILMILEKLGAEDTAPARTDAPLPPGPWPTLPPQPSEADRPTGDPSGPSTPTRPKPFPANAANPAEAVDPALGQAVHHLVWGETKNGLQAGIAFLGTDERVYEIGESVPIAVRLRNVSSEPKTIKYTSARLRFAQPQIEGPKGERVQVIMPPRVRYVFPTIETSLKPGQEITFAVVQLQLAAEKPTQVSTPHIVASPGEYRITYTVPLMERDSREWPVTGTLRFEVADKKADSKALRFSEPREVVLSMNSMHYMLDLDTGKTIDPPARADRPEIAQMDVHATQMQPYQLPTGLSGAPSFFIPGQPMRGMKVKSSQWNASAAEVRRALAGDDVPPLTEMEYKPLEPATYFFKTEAGADGILELMALVEEPKGIRIRYKTITSERTKEAKKSSRAAADKLQTSDLFELRLASRQPTEGWSEAAVADSDEVIYVSNKPVATSADVSSAEAIEDPAGQPALQITFNAEAAARLGHATDLYRGQLLAIVVEGKVLTAPVIRDPITTKAVMVGNLSRAETKRIAEILSATPRQKLQKLSSPAANAGSWPSETTHTLTKLEDAYRVPRAVETIACSVDGKLIAVANDNPNGKGTPMLAILHGEGETPTRLNYLNLTSAEENAVTFTPPRRAYIEVTALAFSPDGSALAVGTDIGQVKLYDMRNGDLVRSLDDEKAKLADKETPENWKTLKRAIGRVESLAFSPDSSLLAVCGSSFADFSDVFDQVEGRRLGRHVSGPGRLKVFDAKSGELKHDLAGHSQVFDVAFSSDGSQLASAGRWEDANGHGNGVLVWNPQTGEKMRSVSIDANGGTQYVAFAPNKKLIVTGSVQFDKENDTRATTVALTYALSGITEWAQTVPGWSKPAFTPDGQSVVVLSGRESIRVLNADTGHLKHELKAADSLPGRHWNDFALGPQSKLILAGVTAEHRGIVEVRAVDGRQATPP